MDFDMTVTISRLYDNYTDARLFGAWKMLASHTPISASSPTIRIIGMAVVRKWTATAMALMIARRVLAKALGSALA
jgi:hypothetical protein